MEVRLIEKQNLDLCVDSVEFSQIFPNVAAIGCYELNQETQIREGAIHILKVENESMIKIQKVEVPGIFGMLWYENLLATANAGGNLLVFQMNEENKNINLICEYDTKECNSLSISWSPSGKLISNSYHSGALEIFTLESNTLSPIWKNETAHSNEAWISHFDRNDNSDNIFYSGADDCLLKGWDIRSPNCSWTNKRQDAGVTCIETSNNFPNRIIVGSYDENLRLYDLRKPTGECFSSVNVGGGVWRIKSRPQDNKIAVAAMRGFYHIAEIKDDNLELLCCYSNVHPSESLSYGVDWLPNSNYLIGGSFYDKLISLWTIDI